MKQGYLVGALVASIVTSIGGVVYTAISKKKIDRLYDEIESKKDDFMKSVESEVSELKETLKKKVDGIADSLDVDIPDEIVEAALRKAADTEATAKIAATSKKVMDEYSVSLRTEVRKSVDLAYANTKIDVKNELTKQISNIDISGIKREIVSESKIKIQEELEDAVKKVKTDFEEKLNKLIEDADEKLEEELDSISTRFNNDLERGSKIYKKLSDKLGVD